MKKPFVIANWKMYKSYNEAVAWCHKHQADLAHASQSVTLGICPGFTALAPIKTILQETKVLVGGQNCSAYQSGAYTGEVPAQSIADIGCNLCIIGHSEQRAYHDETPQAMAAKTTQLLDRAIRPIICVGETQEERESADIKSIITSQLAPILQACTHYTPDAQASIIIAYEPRRAIGSGKIPTNSDIESVTQIINTIVVSHLDIPLPILYGGSVDSTSVHDLKTIKTLSGYLVGGASRDFSSLQAIIKTLSSYA